MGATRTKSSRYEKGPGEHRQGLFRGHQNQRLAFQLGAALGNAGQRGCEHIDLALHLGGIDGGHKPVGAGAAAVGAHQLFALGLQQFHFVVGVLLLLGGEASHGGLVLSSHDFAVFFGQGGGQRLGSGCVGGGGVVTLGGWAQGGLGLGLGQ